MSDADLPPQGQQAVSSCVERAQENIRGLPNLESTFTASRLARLAEDWYVRIWHPLFWERSRELRSYLERLDRAVAELKHAKVTGVEERLKQLREARTPQGFNAHRDELLFAATISTTFPVEFVPKKGPDLRVETSQGQSVNVELTSAVAGQTYARFRALLDDLMSELDPEASYQLRIVYRSTNVVIPEATAHRMMQAVREHILSHPGPSNARLARSVAQDEATGLSLRLVPAPPGCGVVTASSYPGFSPPPVHFMDQILERVMTKSAQQLPDTEPNVVLVDMVLGDPGAALLLGDERRREMFDVRFGPGSLPVNVDAVVLVWVDGLGRSWGDSAVFRNPSSDWCSTPEAERLLNILTASLPGTSIVTEQDRGE